MSGPGDPDDVTLWAGRLRAWPAASQPSVEHPSDGDPVDDETVRSIAGAVDDDTIVSREPGVGAVVVAPDDDVFATAPRRRAGSQPAPELDEATRRRPVISPSGASASEADDSTTTGVRRRRAPRAAQAAVTAGSEVPGTARTARIPAAGELRSYGPRTDGPVRVERRSPEAVRPGANDAAAVRPRTSRRRPLRLLLVAGFAVVLVGAAVGAAVLLLS